MSSQAPLRVLVVDDRVSVQRAVTRVLSEDSRFYVIGTAGSHTEAVQIAALRHPDIALVDVRMPDGGGPAATAQLLTAAPHMRVVAYSADTSREAVKSMVAAGVWGYLVKGDDNADVVIAALLRVAAGDVAWSVELPPALLAELPERRSIVDPS